MSNNAEFRSFIQIKYLLFRLMTPDVGQCKICLKKILSIYICWRFSQLCPYWHIGDTDCARPICKYSSICVHSMRIYITHIPGAKFSEIKSRKRWHAFTYTSSEIDINICTKVFLSLTDKLKLKYTYVHAFPLSGNVTKFKKLIRHLLHFIIL